MELSNDQKIIAVLGSTLIQIIQALDHPKEAYLLDEKMKMWLNEIKEKAKAKERDSSSFKIILPEGHKAEKEVQPQI